MCPLCSPLKMITKVAILSAIPVRYCWSTVKKSFVGLNGSCGQTTPGQSWFRIGQRGRSRHFLLPGFPVTRLVHLDANRFGALAEAVQTLLRCCNALFQTDFPCSMDWHGAPSGYGTDRHWQLHAHFYPPLLRSATVKKYMVGFEMLAEGQRDIIPELCLPAVFQRRRSHRTPRRRPQSRVALDSAGLASRAWPPGKDLGLRRRLSDAGRHLHPRLCSRCRSDRRPYRNQT